MLANTTCRAPNPPANAIRTAVGALATFLLRQFNRFAQAWRHRRDLALLTGFDDHMLADIGLTRADLNDAIAEPRWRDPTALLAERVSERRLNRATASLEDRIFGVAGNVRVSDANPHATVTLNW